MKADACVRRQETLKVRKQNVVCKNTKLQTGGAQFRGGVGQALRHEAAVPVQDGVYCGGTNF